MEKWTLRRAKQSDAEALAACIDAAYTEYATRITDLPSASTDCAAEIAKFQVWVAEVQSGIIGGLVLIAEQDFMTLANVAVHPDHRGMGLGRELMALAENEAREQGYRELRLNTHALMPDNVRLYEHLGWTQTGRQGNKISMRKPV